MIVVDEHPDFRSWNGSVRVRVELGTPCDGCAEPIRSTEAAYFRWWRTSRRSKDVFDSRLSGTELVHVACVVRPAVVESADPIMDARS